jgi:RNA polymerase I-specific transcription initiation factor RRN6
LLQISDLELAAPILKDFLKGLQDDQNSGAYASLVLTSLNSCPGIRFPIRQGSIFPDVLDIYDHVGETWLASLPLEVPNISRWSKFRMARQLAVELWLSSILASIRLKPPRMETAQGQLMAEIDSTLLNTQGDHPRDDITPFMFSQIPANPSENAGLQNSTSHTLPYSYIDVPTNRREPTEDPTVSRLRQYAVSIKSQLDLGKSTLLDPWPSSPGSDPAQAVNGYIANCLRLSHEAQSHQTDRMREREEARRGRRTDRFLTRGITKVSEAKSQPDYTQFGSQPEFTAHARSSQIFEDIPMSQPDRGVFGSRSAQLVKKKRKPRAAGF